VAVVIAIRALIVCVLRRIWPANPARKPVRLEACLVGGDDVGQSPWLESESDEIVRPRLLAGSRGPPGRLRAADPKSPEAVRLEEPELMAAELAGIARLPGVVPKCQPQVARAERPIPNTKPGVPVRSVKERAREAACGDPRREEKYGRLTFPRDVGTHVELGERHERKAAEPSTCKSYRDDRDQKPPADGDGLHSLRKGGADCGFVHLPACDDEMPDVEVGPHGEEA